MSQRSISHRNQRRRGSLSCGASLAPGHRITIFITVLLVVTVHVWAGRSVTSAVEILAAAGAAAAQIGCWLSGQPLAVVGQNSLGGTR
ncbi:hypothetical protein [Streptomyces sp. NPDC101455]|uniref:hypothetical protein n=1 Tax=Streptomyces sp. NPDC101455 TaxID=3366142 RepID=UPI003801B31E